MEQPSDAKCIAWLALTTLAEKARLAAARVERFLPAMSSVENRYAEARPNAAAMIAADWSGGAMQTSFRVVQASYSHVVDAFQI